MWRHFDKKRKLRGSWPVLDKESLKVRIRFCFDIMMPERQLQNLNQHKTFLFIPVNQDPRSAVPREGGLNDTEVNSSTAVSRITLILRCS